MVQPNQSGAPSDGQVSRTVRAGGLLSEYLAAGWPREVFFEPHRPLSAGASAFTSTCWTLADTRFYLEAQQFSSMQPHPA